MDFRKKAFEVGAGARSCSNVRAPWPAYRTFCPVGVDGRGTTRDVHAMLLRGMRSVLGK